MLDRSKLVKLLVLVGLFGTTLAANNYVQQMDSDQVKNLLNEMQSSTVQKATYIAGGTRGGHDEGGNGNG